MSSFLLVSNDNVRASHLHEAFATSLYAEYGLDVVSSLEEAKLSSGVSTCRLIFLEAAFLNSDFITILRASEGCTPVIALITQEDEKTGESTLDMGATDYLFSAEITARQLSRSIRYALNQQKSWLALRACEKRHQVMMDSKTQGVGLAKLSSPGPTNIPEAEHRETTQSRLASIVESSDDAIFSETTNGVILTWNRGAEELLGYSAQEAIGQTFKLVTPPERVTEKLNILERLRQGEQISHYETQRRHKDGTLIDISLSAFPLYNADGAVVGVSGVARDITQQKRDQEARTCSENLYHTLASNFPNGSVCMYDLDSRFILVEGRGLELVGLNREGMLGKTILEVLGDTQVGRDVHDAFLRVVNGEEVVLETQIQDHTRLVHMIPVRDGQGAVKNVLSMTQDITEQRRARVALERSEKLYATLASNFPNGCVLFLDHELRFVLAEGRGLAQLGLDGQQMIGQSLHAVFGNFSGGEENEALYQQALKGQDVTAEVIINGLHRWVHVVPIREDGEIIGVMGIAQDITSLKQTEQALRESEELNRTVLNSMLAHIVVLDQNGEITTVNEPWLHFAQENQWKEALLPSYGLGMNYLKACDTSGRKSSAEANRAARGIREVLEGSRESFSLEYPCHSRTEKRWFQMTVTPLGTEKGGAVVAHTAITERKLAENELRASQERLHVALQSGQIGLWEWDASNNATSFSEQYKKQLGYEEDEFDNSQSAYIDRLHPEEKAAVLKRNLELQQQGASSYQNEFQMRHKDGSYRWILSQGTIFYDDEGIANRILGAHIDITDLKRAEAELIRSRAALQHAYDDLEVRVEERTAELAQTNEALQAEVKERQMAIGALREAVTQLERAKEATERANTELQANEMHLLHGNRTFTDLTKLRVTGQDELESALHAITEAGSDVLALERCSVWIYREDETAIRCLDLYERSPNRHSQGLQLDMGDYPQYFRALQSRENIVADDAHTHPATAEFSASYLTPLDIFSMLDAPIVIGGQMVGVLCCEQIGQPRQWKVEDQTFSSSLASVCSLALESLERARAEAELRHTKDEADQARQDAESANRAKSEFLSRMSHELRTPLNSIIGFGQLLKRSKLEDKQRERMDLILNAGQHLLNLINEVLDIARVESGQMQLSIEPVRLADAIGEALALIQPLANRRSITMTNTSEGEDFFVLADRQRLKQVLLNVLSNSVKYNYEGGRVNIRCDFEPDERLAISVSNTGRGIAPEKLSRLFMPFDRLGEENSDIEGTGLGLALSKRLLEAMDGTLTVQSEPDVETTFQITLPIGSDPEETLNGIDPQSLHTSLPPGKNYQILYIEDNLTNLKLIEGIFADFSPRLRLIPAMQGGIGLELAREHCPDLILLDLHLPDMNGSEVLHRLQDNSKTHDIPVIVLSADATPGQVERLLAQGAHHYLTKPLDVETLLSTVDEILLAH